MNNNEPLIPKYGGYKKLKSFQISQLVFDVTVIFVEKYISRFSRTCDQMVQAARSGVQNIAEGSQTSGTSKKSELRLTNVASASLEELKLDYEDYLRQNNLLVLLPDDPILIRFKSLKPKTVQEIREWVNKERLLMKANKLSVLSSDCLVANAALSLLNLACYLLDQQIKMLANDFENEGGFNERLYRVRKNKRMNQKGY